MTITVDWANKVVESTDSITDLVLFHEALRDLEAAETGVLYQAIHTYKRLDLGGGAYFHAVDFINSYVLKFPSAGNYTINGNLNCTISPVAGVYVERKTSAAFATTSSGGSGPSAADIAAAILAAAAITPIAANVQKMNDADVIGTGTAGDAWRGVGVPP